MKSNRFKWLAAILVVAGIAVLAVGWSLFSEGVSANGTPGAIETFLARNARHLAIPSNARELKNPVTETPDVLAGAMEHFADHCATCHANNGDGKTLIGRGLYPKPPDLTQPSTQNLSDGELYYIIENGIRFTGMPAFAEDPGSTQATESWALVTFIRHLPKLTTDEEEAMKKMNPKSPMEIEQEEATRKFLEGDDSAPETPPQHHHH